MLRMSQPRSMRNSWCSIGIAAAFMIVACVSDPSAPRNDPDTRVSYGKAVAGISVSSVRPDSATQDTTLDVVINGSGFVAGSVANWALAGIEDPTQVRTNSTRYVSSRQLVANITITATATIARWDVVVRAGSKGGIGTESFEIKAKVVGETDSRANYVVANQVNVAEAGEPADYRPSGLQGDGRLKDGSSANGGDSEYQGQFCNAGGRIFNTGPTGNIAGHLNFDPDNGFNAYCGAPRFYKLFLGGANAAPTQASPYARVDAIWYMGPGEVALKPVGFEVALTNCAVLRFDDAFPPSQNLRISRLPDVNSVRGTVRQWRIDSRGNHTATCVNTGRGNKTSVGASYYMPLSIIVTEVLYPAPAYP